MSNQAVNTILQTGYNWKPIDVSEMNASIRQQKALQYDAATKKQAKQDALEAKLLEVASMGLPKKMQEELNADVNKLIKGVESGEFDPESLDFRLSTAGILGRANTYEQARLDAIDFSKQRDLQIIDQDENGNPVDKMDEFRDGFLRLYNEGYDPAKDTRANESFLPSLYQNQNRALKSMNFDPITINKTQENALKTDGEAFQDWNKSKAAGYWDVTEGNRLTEEGKKKFVETFIFEQNAPLMSQYAATHPTQELRDADPFSSWRIKVAESYMPVGNSKVSREDDKAYDAAQKLKQVLAGKNKEPKFTINETETNWLNIVGQISKRMGKKETEEQYTQRQKTEKDFVKSELIQAGIDPEKESVKRIFISSTDGKDLPKRTIGGVEGTPIEFYRGEKSGATVALMNVELPSQSQTIHSKVAEGDQKGAKVDITQQDKKRFELRIVRVTDLDGLLDSYKVTETENNSDPLNLGL